MSPARLSELRKQMGLSQEALAALLGLTRDAIARMEAGSRPIELRTRLAIAAISHGLEPAS